MRISRCRQSLLSAMSVLVLKVEPIFNRVTESTPMINACEDRLGCVDREVRLPMSSLQRDGLQCTSIDQSHAQCQPRDCHDTSWHYFDSNRIATFEAVLGIVFLTVNEKVLAQDVETPEVVPAQHLPRQRICHVQSRCYIVGEKMLLRPKTPTVK
ncbi:hypothetical protein T440DRAFT_267133 [Plenodomus tracheiphilus IPT5]|uniref:Uncharacterized protein n=1 Tax=Plenodomus tracheiphilus IPT5 TaxID=1408161 RepID=A0A6A7BH78_9PLEO|nr:hypothetical protein T440DRAFT_267133 [Plenodomus tracheiphilus IPT5]